MPQVKDGPKELNDMLHIVYTACMKRKNDAEACSKIAWSAAKDDGWHNAKGHSWTKKKGAY